MNEISRLPAPSRLAWALTGSGHCIEETLDLMARMAPPPWSASSWSTWCAPPRSGPRHGRCRLHRVMLDTGLKDGRSLRDHLSSDALAALIGQTCDAGSWAGLAGAHSAPVGFHLIGKTLASTAVYTAHAGEPASEPVNSFEAALSCWAVR
ncbi:(5-formylfuran-3-yl)methyl phosphate synthase [Azospirillum sp.]|uniref:(5-formylfuran-3-yl)methyl phosphate synthase n=1 Tax=Azospirillum sp. TaxID=34012 RepID=UPI0039C87066